MITRHQERAVWAGVVLTATMLVIALIQSYRRIAVMIDPNVEFVFVIKTFTTSAVFIAVFGTAFAINSIRITTHRWLPWVAGGIAFVAAFVPWLLVQASQTSAAEAIYRALNIPQGRESFADLGWILQSLDCARSGIDVFAADNGCTFFGPTIYGEGMLWVRFIPGMTYGNTAFLGVTGIALSSLALVWIARNSPGPGPLVILIAAVSTPWLLLMERGNVDMVILWGAVLIVWMVRRWNIWPVWIGAAALIWLFGTWKYAPFAMGVMLLPALMLRRGWLLILGFLVATSAFMATHWEQFQGSSDANRAMVVIADTIVLGRDTIVARFAGGSTDSFGADDFVVFALAIFALVWGVFLGRTAKPHQWPQAMAACGGGALFLITVLVSGFGWAYKSAFLLLMVPLLGAFTTRSSRALQVSGLLGLMLVTVASVVVWNTQLASLAGIIAASLGFGAGLGVFTTLLGQRRSVHSRP